MLIGQEVTGCDRLSPSVGGRRSSNQRIELGFAETRRAFKFRTWPRTASAITKKPPTTGILVDQQSAGGLPSIFDDGDVYDLVGKDVPYGLDFYVNLARAASGSVLDIACGTGRILLPCLQAGVDIEGLDFYEPMLKTLRAKAAALGLSPRLHQADMSDFSLPRRFSLVMIPFNAFIHNMTQEAQIRCLQLCREHLVPGGKLSFDTFFPSVEIIGTPAKTRVLEGEMPHPQTGLPMRMYDTRTFDRVAQVQHSLNEIELLAADGSIETVHRSEFSTRYIYKHEMELLLRVAGFRRWEICGDFDGRPLTRENDAMIVTAWS
jgi:SAM-dependent methyltransferase